MAQTGTSRFTCNGCGRTYRWKHELAGKKVKCGCGNVMTAPEVPAGTVEMDPIPEDNGLYDLASDPEIKAKPKQHLPEGGEACPACSAALVPGAKICVQCGHNLLTGKPVSTSDALPKAAAAKSNRATPIGYQRPSTSGSSTVERMLPDPIKDFYLPLGLIAGGTVIQFGYAVVVTRNRPDVMLAAMSRIGLSMVVSAAMMLVAILIVGRIRKINFGSLPVAVMKLCAVSIAPRAIAMLVGPLLLLIPVVGGFGFWVVDFIFYFALLGALFDLDESDTWYCVMVIFLVSLGVFFGLKGLGWTAAT